MTTFFDIVLALVAFAIAAVGIGGHSSVNRVTGSRGISWRGWLTLILLIITLSVTIWKVVIVQNNERANEKRTMQLQNDVTALMKNRNLLEKDILLLREANSKLQDYSALILYEIRQENANNSAIESLQTEIQRSHKIMDAIKTRMQVEQSLLGSIASKEQPSTNKIVSETAKLYTDTPGAGTPTDRRSQALDAKIHNEGELQIVASSFQVRQGEAFIFHVRRLDRGQWTTLYPNEIRISTPGQCQPIDIGREPSFALSGTGPTDLVVHDIFKGGTTKCTVIFSK